MIASGGAGNIHHISDVAKETDITGIAIASILHYKILNISKIKNELNKYDIDVRQ